MLSDNWSHAVTETSRGCSVALPIARSGREPTVKAIIDPGCFAREPRPLAGSDETLVAP